MVVWIDKATAVRMYDKVQAHWAASRSTAATRQLDAGRLDDDPGARWSASSRCMEATDMAVVVSQAQNEIEDLAAKGLDIVAAPQADGRTRTWTTKFKDPDDPLRLVFVCAMWMTGFDVPSCSTIYLDKPMRNHTLMQTIARANRVSPGKNRPA